MLQRTPGTLYVLADHRGPEPLDTTLAGICMHLLYPGNPLDPKAVDDTYAEEHAAAVACGMGTSLFSFEDFETGTFRPRPALPPQASVLYRGWMLTVPRYTELAAGIAAKGAIPFTSVDEYRSCHHLPSWYSQVEDMTAETVVLPEGAQFETELAHLNWPGYFVKDYVKSLSTAGGSLASSPQDVGRVVALLSKFRGFIEGGICVRRREDFVPGSERRYFVLRGKAYSASGSVPGVVAECAARISSPFFSVDTANIDGGATKLVELGDGQVSDRKEWPADMFVEMLGNAG